MDWFRWFEWYLEVLCWGCKHEPPLGGERDPLLPQEMWIETAGTALGWTAYGAAPQLNRTLA